MSRFLTIAAAQSGPISRQTSRREVVARLVEQLREAHGRGCELIVFTECALTAFFPHWWIEDETELDAWFETAMPGPATQPLFAEARRLGIGFYLGYAELAVEGGIKHRYNSSLLVGADGEIIGKYRKIHLPGYAERHPHHPFQNLEKRYFEVGNLGFRTWRSFGGVVGMCICNDRRWAEAYRVLALQGAELILLGYNTPDHIPDQPEIDHLCNFHHLLSMQAGAYQNGCWVVGVAKAGVEEGVSQIGQTAIIAPSGEIVARSSTLDNELVVYRCDLDLVKPYKERLFNFARHRRIEHYQLIATQTGAMPPPK
jgi:predicted amidohydrolase